jgi:hypothetical protein
LGSIRFGRAAEATSTEFRMPTAARLLLRAAGARKADKPAALAEIEAARAAGAAAREAGAPARWCPWRDRPRAWRRTRELRAAWLGGWHLAEIEAAAGEAARAAVAAAWRELPRPVRWHQAASAIRRRVMQPHDGTSRWRQAWRRQFRCAIAAIECALIDGRLPVPVIAVATPAACAQVAIGEALAAGVPFAALPLVVAPPRRAPDGWKLAFCREFWRRLDELDPPGSAR